MRVSVWSNVCKDAEHGEALCPLIGILFFSKAGISHLFCNLGTTWGIDQEWFKWVPVNANPHASDRYTPSRARCAKSCGAHSSLAW